MTIDNGPLTYEYFSPTPEVGQDKNTPTHNIWHTTDHELTSVFHLLQRLVKTRIPPHIIYDIDNRPWTYECVSPTPEVGQDKNTPTHNIWHRQQTMNLRVCFTYARGWSRQNYTPTHNIWLGQRIMNLRVCFTYARGWSRQDKTRN